MQSNQARLFFYQLNRKTHHKNSQAGLTLTEVLVVGLILAILIISQVSSTHPSLLPAQTTVGERVI